MKYPALLYEKLPKDMVRCHICQWRCRIAPGKLGLCRMRRNEAGNLYLLNYALASSVAVDPIEKKPLFHFFPGSLVFSLGTWGCNFHCQHCQNWEISCVEQSGEGRSSRQIYPEEAIRLTEQSGSSGIAWTYNEPTIWFEYTVEAAKLAKRKKLYTVYVTNGFITPEALDIIGPYLDAWRVDVKGFSDALYQKLAKVIHWRKVLEMAKLAQEKWAMHLEVVTNIIPSLNDDEEQLESIARWICEELGELTPWHVTRFYPHHYLTHLPPTPLPTLEKAYALGKKSGLRFVYLGNVPGHSKENTVCYNCGNLIIRRLGYNTSVVGAAGSKCKFCQAELNIRLKAKTGGGDNDHAS